MFKLTIVFFFNWLSWQRKFADILNTIFIFIFVTKPFVFFLSLRCKRKQSLFHRNGRIEIERYRGNQVEFHSHRSSSFTQTIGEKRNREDRINFQKESRSNRRRFKKFCFLQICDKLFDKNCRRSEWLLFVSNNRYLLFTTCIRCGSLMKNESIKWSKINKSTGKKIVRKLRLPCSLMIVRIEKNIDSVVFIHLKLSLCLENFLKNQQLLIDDYQKQIEEMCSSSPTLLVDRSVVATRTNLDKDANDHQKQLIQIQSTRQLNDSRKMIFNPLHFPRTPQCRDQMLNGSFDWRKRVAKDFL